MPPRAAAAQLFHPRLPIFTSSSSASSHQVVFPADRREHVIMLQQWMGDMLRAVELEHAAEHSDADQLPRAQQLADATLLVYRAAFEQLVRGSAGSEPYSARGESDE